MALTSVFYDGPVTETDRATSRAGAPDYGVYGADDFKVSTHPSIPYALVVKAGRAHGWGVTDTAATDQTVQCAALASGTRWDLITVRRNWQPLLGGPSTLEVVQGGTTAVIPAGRKVGPGVEDDQPLALVEWRGGVNTPNRIIDLRCWAANGGMVVADILALDYLARPGADVLIGATTWRYGLDANGVWVWSANRNQVVAAGKVTVSIAATASNVTKTVTLPPGLAVAPTIQLTMASNIGSPASKLKIASLNETKTSFQVKLYTDDYQKIGVPYNIIVNWLAVLAG